MQITRIENYTRGWFIGDFEPSVLRTKGFEVGLLTHKKGEYWAPHYHKESVEYNLLVSGSMTIQNKLLNPGDLFVFEKGEIRLNVNDLLNQSAVFYQDQNGNNRYDKGADSRISSTLSGTNISASISYKF